MPSAMDLAERTAAALTGDFNRLYLPLSCVARAFGQEERDLMPLVSDGGALIMKNKV